MIPMPLRRLIPAVFALGVAATGAVAGDQAFEQNVFGFGGVLTTGNMHQSARPLQVGYENNGVFGGGFQRLWSASDSFSFGLEAGAAARLGGRATGEVWVGAVIRHDAFALGPDTRLSPALTVGISQVSATHRGRETFLEDRYEGSAKRLFYLGPELILSSAAAPNREIFWRLHHRSGGGRTLGNMKGAANANVVGLRVRF